MVKTGFSMYLFLIGVGGAILLGLLEGMGVEALSNATWVPWLLVLVGVLIGLFNVTMAEAQGVILGALALGAGLGILSLLPAVGGVLDAVVSKVAFLSLAVAVPPAFKILWKNLS